MPLVTQGIVVAMAKIGLVGWGIETQGVYNFYGPDNEYLIVNEEPRDDFPPQSDKVKVQFINQQRAPGLTGNVEDLSYLEGLDTCDKVVISPTSTKNLEKLYPPNNPFWQKVTSDRQIFFEAVKTKNIIGVTGTKGKGTTSTLITKMLEAAGKKVYLGGNIGQSVLDFVNRVQPDDWVVLELANFQLYKFPYSPHIAVCLMIAPDHLDWHPNAEEYIDTKANIFRHQKPEDIDIYFAQNEHSAKIAQLSQGKKIPYYQKPGAYVRDDGMIAVGEEETEILPKSKVKLLGEHNLQNVCAAITAVWQVSRNMEAIKQVLTSFSGLEHRLELVRELNGVKYYDDSFSTTPETAIVALKALPYPKVIILGGWDKGASFEELAEEVTKDNVRHAIVIGVTAPKIVEALKSRGFTDITTGLTKMTDIVVTARQKAQSGDAVLLSTACASFGLFKDYKDRGNQFKAAVRALV
jgi:UDP-N-acetylmuramoylalanine--D-glutamate ligase